MHSSDDHQVGIVLRIHDTGSGSITVLDRDKGLIRIVVVNAKNKVLIAPGWLMSYVFHTSTLAQMHTGSVLRVHDVEPLAQPNTQGFTELAFVHQLLEIAYFSIPYGAQAPEVFQLLMLLYCSEHAHVWANNLVRSLCVLRLLLLLGIYPDTTLFQEERVYEFIEVPLAALARVIEELNLQATVDQWVMQALRAHHAVAHFKTRCIERLDRVPLPAID